MYSAEVLDHFEHPRNAGTIADADASARIENPACGDILELSLKIDGDRIAEICFRAKGCVAAMACASALTELVRGKSIGEARKLTREDVLRAVGGLPPASSHAGHMAMDALDAVLQRIAKRK
ncbi:MAG: iron-sulfur cluster assembly scaffold protein [Terracidiphilus sp.]|jgi:nitrogen fixation NifU-like protein